MKIPEGKYTHKIIDLHSQFYSQNPKLILAFSFISFPLANTILLFLLLQVIKALVNLSPNAKSYLTRIGSGELFALSLVLAIVTCAIGYIVNKFILQDAQQSKGEQENKEVPNDKAHVINEQDTRYYMAISPINWIPYVLALSIDGLSYTGGKVSTLVSKCKECSPFGKDSDLGN